MDPVPAPAQPSPTPAPTPTPAPAAPPKTPEQDVAENKDVAALSYVWILSVFVYFSKKDSPFVRFHARQGMVLFGLSILFWLIPYVGRLLMLLVLAGSVLGFLSAAQGQWKETPLVGPLSRGDKEGIRESWRHIVHSIVMAWEAFRKTMKSAMPPTPPPAPAKPADPKAPAQTTPSAPPSGPSTVPAVTPVTPPSPTPLPAAPLPPPVH